MYALEKEERDDRHRYLISHKTDSSLLLELKTGESGPLAAIVDLLVVEHLLKEVRAGRDVVSGDGECRAEVDVPNLELKL